MMVFGPFVSVEEIEKVVTQAKQSGAAILGVSHRGHRSQQAEREFVESTLTREHLVLAQTPQVFQNGNIETSFRACFQGRVLRHR
jgi:2-C-methyl-D-erythritol 4-phosphate cytidylyltransferase